MVDLKVLGAIFGETVPFHLLKYCDDYVTVASALEDKYMEFNLTVRNSKSSIPIESQR
jgi:hypothetical protein